MSDEGFNKLIYGKEDLGITKENSREHIKKQLQLLSNTSTEPVSSELVLMPEDTVELKGQVVGQPWGILSTVARGGKLIVDNDIQKVLVTLYKAAAKATGKGHKVTIVSSNEDVNRVLSKLNLYKKFGFEIEGEAKDFAFRNGDYVSAYYMARISKAN